MNVDGIVKELGGEKCQPGPGSPNWMYACGFPSKEAAEDFIFWLDVNGFEHGPPLAMRDKTYDVRYSK